MQQEEKWEQYKEQQHIYEKNLYKYNQPEVRFDTQRQAERPWEERVNEYVVPLSLHKLTFQDRQTALNEFEQNQKLKQAEFQLRLEQQQKQLTQARVSLTFCFQKNLIYI